MSEQKSNNYSEQFEKEVNEDMDQRSQEELDFVSQANENDSEEEKSDLEINQEKTIY